MIRSTFRPALLLTAGLWFAGAPALAQQRVDIRFEARVDAAAFECGKSYAKGDTRFSGADFRFYVHKVQLIKAGGGAVDVQLEQDGHWQFQDVALLDFENQGAGCEGGTREMRTRIVGTLPRDRYKGIRFELGVPFALNHADVAAAPAPLNLPALYSNRRNGYQFARLDLVATRPSGETHEFPIRIGSTACTGLAQEFIEKSMRSPPQPGNPPGGEGILAIPPTACGNPNRAAIELPAFNPGTEVIVADLGALIHDTNLMVESRPTPGCMSAPEDLDCVGIMRNLGLPFRGLGGQQRFFRTVKAVRRATTAR